MSEQKIITREPVQITDGTNNAHITVESGSILYADSADSPAWHKFRHSRKPLTSFSPVKLWVKVWSGDSAEICVTTWTE